MSHDEYPGRGRRLIDEDGCADVYDEFLDARSATALFARLRAEVAWREEFIVMYGREVRVPRRVAWYGDPQAVYRYSGVVHEPLPWLAPLTTLRAQIEIYTAYRFNSVLANLYRDGNDSMGWHADKERELGRNPAIASVSLGAARLFRLRHNRTRRIVEVVLKSGSLLVMAGALQHHWRHCVPKSRDVPAERINLTFRRIITPTT